jgi:aspartyl-tRNA(Asn)/glutamyl-tRNA(Gln) amidotransferase subunit A
LSLGAGALISSSDYQQAQRVRRIGRSKLLAQFDSVDALVMPTSTIVAPPLDSISLGSVDDALLTEVWNSVGFPALSVPMGVGAAGLPLSLQIITRPFADALALQIGDAYQQITDWHMAAPRIARAASTD